MLDVALDGSIEERFLSAQANHSFGNEWEEKALACFARNDGWRLASNMGKILPYPDGMR
jgi:hypothetical protein